MWVYSSRFYNHNDGADMKKLTVAALAVKTLIYGSALSAETGVFFMRAGSTTLRPP